jgi:hypothetical protein
MLLVLKLVLVPALVAAVTLAGRRWGAVVAGLLGSLPIVSGPALVFYAIEQGDAFAADASRAILVTLVPVSAAALTYAWASLVAPWWVSAAAGCGTFAVAVLAVERVAWTPQTALPVALAGIALARALLPPVPGAGAPAVRSGWDLPLRVLSTVGLLLVLTSIAARLGPDRTGVFTAFPVALGILLAFTHVQQGAVTAVRFLRGFLPGMGSTAAFCFVAALALRPLGAATAFTLALATSVSVQAAVVWWTRRWDRPAS